MTEPANIDAALARLARVRDEQLADVATGAAAGTLLASVTATPVPPAAPAPRGRPVRRLALAAAAVVAVTGAAVAGPGLLADKPGGATSYANAAIDVRRDGRFFVARIKDPLADGARYAEAFRAVGKDVRIELVPVGPRQVGQLLESGGGGPGSVEGSTELVGAGPDAVDCALAPATCTIVIRISTDSTGWTAYKVGRAARPGEPLYDPDATIASLRPPGAPTGTPTAGWSTGPGSSTGGGN